MTETPALTENNPRWPAPTVIASWAAQLTVFAVFAVVGPLPKLSGAPETVALFNEVGIGDAGRYAAGLGELAAMVLIVIPRTAWLGGFLTVGAMLGAIGSHLFTPLGVIPQFEVTRVVDGVSTVETFSPGPMLIVLALVALIAGGVTAVLRRREIPVVGPALASFGRAAPAEPLATPAG